MTEAKVLKSFVSFLKGLEKEPVKTELADLKRAYPNEWAIFAEGELGEKVGGLCIYCGEVTKNSTVCAGCDLLSDCDYYKADDEDYF